MSRLCACVLQWASYPPLSRGAHAREALGTCHQSCPVFIQLRWPQLETQAVPRTCLSERPWPIRGDRVLLVPLLRTRCLRPRLDELPASVDPVVMQCPWPWGERGICEQYDSRHPGGEVPCWEQGEPETGCQLLSVPSCHVTWAQTLPHRGPPPPTMSGLLLGWGAHHAALSLLSLWEDCHFGTHICVGVSCPPPLDRHPPKGSCVSPSVVCSDERIPGTP